MSKEKLKYIRGAFVIAETKCKGREKEIVKSAAKMFDKLEQQHAEMLAMLKEMTDGGRFSEAEVRALIRKVEGE